MRLAHAVCLGLSASYLLGCTEPAPNEAMIPPVALVVVSGSGQSGLAGQELPQPLVVRVVRPNGKGVAGQLVNFRVTGGGGSVFAGAALTDASGTAQEWWTLGPTRGPQQIDVVAVDPSTGAKQNFGTFTATAILPAALTIAPSSAAFGNLGVGATSPSITFTVTNAGDQTSGSLTVSRTGAHVTDFPITQDACQGTTLAGGASCTVAIVFSPTALGTRSASLSVAGTPGGTVTASLGGSGIQAPVLGLSPTTYNFGTVATGQASSSALFQIANTGTATANGLSVTLVDPSGFFQITNNPCNGVNLPPGATTCPVAVRYQPTSAGSHTATLQVTSTNGGSAIATLSGQAVPPPILGLSPTTKNFGTLTVGSTASQVFTLSNTGGSATAALIVDLEDLRQTGSLSLSGDQCSGQSLAPGQACTVTVAFTPQVTGTIDGYLSIRDGSSEAAASLIGVGQSPNALLEGSIPSHNFGSTVVGSTSPAVTVTVTNNGAQAAGALAVAISGTHPTDFAVQSDSCTGVALASAATCTVSVTFSPTAGGARSATLSITGSPGGTVAVALAGTGIVPATLQASPTTLAFGSFPVSGGSSNPLTVTVTNTGQLTSAIVSAALVQSSTDYFINSNTCASRTLAPGQSCTIQISFNPTALGSRTGVLQIGGGVNSLEVNLIGTGT